MQTHQIVADTETGGAVVIEVVETVDSTKHARARRALEPARGLPRQSLHLKPDEFTIMPQKAPEAQAR